MSTPDAPVAIWDCRDAAWRHRAEEKSAWITSAIPGARYIYRAEFYLLGGSPFARISCYAANEDGKQHWNEHHMANLGQPHDHTQCHAAREQPRIVPLTDLPPPELRS